jgi:hypothetical protein
MKYCRSIGLLISLFFVIQTGAQRSYAPHSVLATGSWFKLSVKAAGVYRIDLPFLNAMGITGNSIPSASIRLFGNGGHMLSEANNANWQDDLKENAIMVVDGGDGQLNGSDYLLFYASGPDEWITDPSGNLFTHKKNLYSDKAYYFLSIGGSGLRVPTPGTTGAASVSITTFTEHRVHELDSINFLNSGKEWYGEELSNLPGRALTRSFPVSLSHAIPNSACQLRMNVVARSVGVSSRFDILLNGQPAGQLTMPSVSGGQYDPFATANAGTFSLNNLQNNNTVTVSYTPGSFNSQGWINWFELFGRCDLSMNGTNQLLFRDPLSVGNSRGEFILTNVQAGTQVWDITDPLRAVKMNSGIIGSELRFVNDCTVLHEYIAFSSSGFLQPVYEGTVVNQDLHGSSPSDMIIITDAPFISPAQRLAAIHNAKGTHTTVFSTQQVYNEFGSGLPDPVAIRDFVKMYYDRYRSGNNNLKYLLLFGDASFDPKDRIRNNYNPVPPYENDNSLDPLGSYCSDDFYGFLDDNEDINSTAVTNLLDIGIGRVPVLNIDDANAFVDKVESYYSSKALGPWRNDLTFVADDEDNNLHFNDAETITATAVISNPLFNIQKIYLDAFHQESGGGGGQYPQANQAINSRIYNGTLIWNYNGHGGPSRLAEETIVDGSIVNGWNNAARLPLFITATCDFAPYDNTLINSLGERILLRPKTGGIALMTTTRPVFAFSNRIMNNNYVRFALERDANTGQYRALGDAIREAKNFTYQSFPDIVNNRKFTLLGDPALTLAFPQLKIRVTSVNGVLVPGVDTLSATENVTIQGEVTDWQDNLLTAFNGRVYPLTLDKPQTVSTRGNDPGSQPATFLTQTNNLFKGEASVTNGKFSFSFKMPRDINYQYGNGKLSLYAEDDVNDANGSFTNFIIGGNVNDNSGDRTGPEIRAYLNDENFVNGGISNQRPVLLLKLADTSGINTAGSGIDHDIVATLDNDNNRFFILNDFYQGDLDNFRKGSVRFQLPELEPGPHTLKVKAWDVLNNSNEVMISFSVAKDEELQLAHVLNYPNPFTTHTQFWFEHNKPGQALQVRLEIMTITGRVVKSMSRSLITEGNRSFDLEWDGRDDYGNKLGRGVYLYKLRVSADGKTAREVIERLVIL